MVHKAIENKALIVSSVVNLIMAGAGFWVFAVTGIQALFLDGFFSLIGCVSTVFAIVVSKISKKRSQAYPDGHYFLEPLYAVLKSLLTLALLIISVVATAGTAYEYFANGTGEPMITGPVLPYTIAMVILCFGLCFYNVSQNRKMSNTSTILSAESKSNYVDGILSFGVGVAIVLMNFIALDGPAGFLHYTGDFFITTVLVLLSIKAPIMVLIESFKELSSGTTSDKEIKSKIQGAVNAHLNPIADNIRCDIFKVGMHIKVRISLLEVINADMLSKYKNARKKILDDLKQKYDSVELVFAF